MTPRRARPASDTARLVQALRAFNRDAGALTLTGLITALGNVTVEQRAERKRKRSQRKVKP